MTSDQMIVTRGLRKSFRGTPVLAGLDLEVGRGQIFALLGPNGAGKTTTVNILSTLTKPDAGTATIAGFDVVRQGNQVRAALSLTGQFAAVDPFQTGAENLRMMARLAHLGRRDRAARVADLLDQFELMDAADRRVATYSGGMRRRLDLAVSLLTSPPLVFLDEPTTGLDPRSRSQVWAVVRELADAGTTILLTTQYLEEADQLADRIAVLNAGGIVAAGTPDQLKSGLAGDRVEVTFDEASALRTARSIWPDESSVFDEERGTLTVPAADPVRTTRELLALAEQHRLAITGISILKPTLDDVFLHLTDASSAGTTVAEEAAA